MGPIVLRLDASELFKTVVDDFIVVVEHDCRPDDLFGEGTRRLAEVLSDYEIDVSIEGSTPIKTLQKRMMAQATTRVLKRYLNATGGAQEDAKSKRDCNEFRP
jgi:hypothetical protein